MKGVEFSPSARADLRRLDRDIARRILRAIDRYAVTGHGLVVRLQDSAGERRLRVGDWRVRFTEGPALIEVLRIRHRGEVYR
jgi:mRNA interferase RelE/StbE